MDINLYEVHTQIQTPDTFDVIGRAPVASTVTVNSQATTRQGERFHKQLTAANATAPVWSSVSVSDGTTTQSGHRFVAKAAIEPDYDGDGNLTGDGRWDYQWDGENRLTVMTTSTIAQTAGVPYQRLVFSYDGQGRRVRKQVFDSPTGAATDDLRFLYDGWNLLIEYRKTGSSAPAVLRSYLWGQDLAGIDFSGQPTQGAGGVGGLLGVTTGGNSYLPAYDGNGNIVAWLNSSTQLVCKQEYDPFGNRIIHEGSVDLPIGFSTKYRDEETNLLYYGYRYYDPATGRWPSRDPIEEAGGVNLYGMVANDPVNKSDFLGYTTGVFRVAFRGAGDVDPLNKFQNFTSNIYSSTDVSSALESVIKHYDKDGDERLSKKDCPPFRIKIVGYSWGGISALYLVKKIGRKTEDPEQNLLIGIGTLDPVTTLRASGEDAVKGGLPSYVKKAYNDYQTNGMWRGRLGVFGAGAFKGSSVSGAVNTNRSSERPGPPWDEESSPKRPFEDHISMWRHAGFLVLSVQNISLDEER